MKKTLLTLVTVFAVLFSVNVSANINVQPNHEQTLIADLTSIKVDPRSELYTPFITSGQVTINFISNEITLVFSQTNPCRGNFCLAVMPAPIVAKFKLEDAVYNECKVITYTAVRQGSYGPSVIQIEDRQYNECLSSQAERLTAITLTQL